MKTQRASQTTPNLPHLCFFVLKSNQILCMRPCRHCAQALHELVNAGCLSVTFQDLPRVLRLLVIPQQQMRGADHPFWSPLREIDLPPAPSLSMTLSLSLSLWSVLASTQWKSQTSASAQMIVFASHSSLETKKGASVLIGDSLRFHSDFQCQS